VTKLIDFTLPVLIVADLPECSLCQEPWCGECFMHFEDCRHPGPDSVKEEKIEAEN